MDYVMQFVTGDTTVETVVRFFVLVLVLSGFFDWIDTLLGGAKR